MIRAPAPARGIACMVACMVFLTLNDAVCKWLTADYAVGEVVCLRSIFMFLPIAVLAWRAGGLASLRVRRLGGQALRALFTVLSAYLFVEALSLMPLADTIAIVFTGPLFVAALARPLLGEHVEWQRWAAILVGFSGVVVLTRPTGEGIGWVALVPLGACLAGTLRDIVTRRISVVESSVATLFFATSATVIASAFTLPFGWRVPAAGDVGLLALAGLLMGGAQFLMIEAFRLAEASLVVPFKYTSMVWAVLLGFLVWGDLPDRWVVAGTILIIGSGIYILYRSRRVFRQGETP